MKSNGLTRLQHRHGAGAGSLDKRRRMVMLFPRKVQGALLAAAVAAAFSTPAFADPTLPQPVHSGDIAYLSGGFGLTERHALEAQAHNYNLEITNANKAGDFTSDTALVIRSKTGHDVLRVRGTGPLFYAKLPAGDYVIHATNDGQNRTRAVRLAAHDTTDVHLIWPQRG
jgi:hypothetical protein